MVTVANSLLTQPETYSEYNTSAMNDKQFARWVELLESRIGVRASALRKTFLTNALDIRLQTLGMQNYNEYDDYLHSGNQGEIEWFELIDLLTIRETRFFRHASSLELLQNHALNKLSQFKNNGQQSLKAWSVGCASGEEAYTLAIVLDQAIKSAGDKSCYFSVMASDISRSALNTGRKGIYSTKQLNNMDAKLIQQHFTALDNNQYQISGQLKLRVCFNKVNVLDIRQKNIGQMDIIFCQNLLYYFEHDTRINILNKLTDYLATDGILILGPGDIFQWDNPDMALVNGDDTLAYRKSASSNPGTTK